MIFGFAFYRTFLPLLQPTYENQTFLFQLSMYFGSILDDS